MSEAELSGALGGDGALKDVESFEGEQPFRTPRVCIGADYGSSLRPSRVAYLVLGAVEYQPGRPGSRS